jgi:hypothetical protein
MCLTPKTFSFVREEKEGESLQVGPLEVKQLTRHAMQLKWSNSIASSADHLRTAL